jgi:hypothetical protein
MAKIVRSSSSAGNRRVEHDNTVIGGVTSVTRRESGITEQACTRTRIESLQGNASDANKLSEINETRYTQQCKR